MGNEVIIDPWMRGGLLKGSDKKLYAPVGTAGYQRTKTTLLLAQGPRRATTNGATPVGLVTGAPGGTTHILPFAAYQSSGGDLVLSLQTGGGDTVWSQNCVTGVITALTPPQSLLAGTWNAVWAGAAGATQYVSVIDYIPTPQIDVT